MRPHIKHIDGIFDPAYIKFRIIIIQSQTLMTVDSGNPYFFKH